MKYSDGQSEFLQVFSFVILCYSRISRKLDALEKLVFYSISWKIQTTKCSHTNTTHSKTEI